MESSTKLHTDSIPYAGLSASQDRMWVLEAAPRNIYVAATISEQGVAARFALQLIDAGFCVTSRWLRNDFTRVPNVSKLGDRVNLHPQLLDHHEKVLWESWKKYEAQWGEQDLEDLERSDTLVVLAHEPSKTGGFHVELGYFLGARRDNIVVVGNRPNVFYWTPSVRWTRTTEGLVDWLRAPIHGAILAPPPVEAATYRVYTDSTGEIKREVIDDEVAF